VECQEPIGILDRPEPRRVQAEGDQRRQLRLFARGMSDIMGRVGPLFGVMRAAAATEPEIAELLQSRLCARRANMETVVRCLERNGPLRAGLSIDESAYTLWTVSSAEVHRLLTETARRKPLGFRPRGEAGLWVAVARSPLVLPLSCCPVGISTDE
jgi:hypothetical protein